MMFYEKALGMKLLRNKDTLNSVCPQHNDTIHKIEVVFPCCKVMLYNIKESITIHNVILEGMKKVELGRIDVYYMCNHVVLDENATLKTSNVNDGDRIFAHMRLRGGSRDSCGDGGGSHGIAREEQFGCDRIVVSYQAIRFDTWIEKLDYEELFTERRIPECLVSSTLVAKEDRDVGFEFLLGGTGKRTFHGLFLMLQAMHSQNLCFEGAFSYHNILYIPQTDSFEIDQKYLQCVKLKPLTPNGFRLDVKSLAEVFEFVCSRRRYRPYPTFVGNLLKNMRHQPENAEYMNVFKAFLRNQPAVLSLTDCFGLVQKTFRYIRYKPHVMQERIDEHLEDIDEHVGDIVGGDAPWRDNFLTDFMSCPILNDFVMLSEDEKYDGVRYFFWIHCAQNLIEHPSKEKQPAEPKLMGKQSDSVKQWADKSSDYDMEDSVMILLVYWDEMLAEFFEKLALHVWSKPHNFLEMQVAERRHYYFVF